MGLSLTQRPAPGDLGDDTRWAGVRAPGKEGGTRCYRKQPEPLGAVPTRLMELAIIAADVVQAHPWGGGRSLKRRNT